MDNHSAMIRELGGPHRLAHDLTQAGVAVKPVTARAWAIRNSIPAKYWPVIQTVAKASGKSITINSLAQALDTGAQQ
ncbi:hypothetical protein BSL82_09650 [Tardibacter chloracetimidivorans]|uniref:Uncharacterized protein n=1 Tax=Tardibacter chloracetimidivorans TaxID=1921510 RepID=A0A1L3ZVA3_9SPHN|nr:hypothetical protein [Tardibacter chloracetimidivorans]API59545.1 hypothetical protein BSL82_09650 [Tardibacter chloracetimidivorans]